MGVDSGCGCERVWWKEGGFLVRADCSLNWFLMHQVVAQGPSVFAERFYAAVALLLGEVVPVRRVLSSSREEPRCW